MTDLHQRAATMLDQEHIINTMAMPGVGITCGCGASAEDGPAYTVHLMTVLDEAGYLKDPDLREREGSHHHLRVAHEPEGGHPGGGC